MPPGGVRSGRPGTAYDNRGDLNRNPRAPSAAVHGDVARREQVKRATPDQRPITRAPLVPLTAPSQRPEEPVTAGVPLGPGPGPESLAGGIAPADDSLWELRALAARMQYPPRDLLRIIALAESEQ